MKKFLVGALIVLVGSGVGVSIVAAKYEPVIRPNTMIGPVPVGGLTKEEAEKRVRWWWETVKTQKLTLKCSEFKKELPAMTPGQLGITVDDVASVAPCELNDFWDSAKEKIAGDPPKANLGIVYKSNGQKPDNLFKLIKSSIGPTRPASVKYEGGAITRTPEVTSFELDEKKLPDVVTEALQTESGEVDVPITEAPKHVPDADLAKITDVISEYYTSFPAYQTSRNTNIRLASEKLSGHVLMPGDSLSFNGTVGERTVRGGFRTAPVLKNGKHDEGIGGGICQVSGTLYNSILLANLKIVMRHNHSTPSVYLPVGRDATVDWPDLDLVFENPGPDPVALYATYETGRLTWRILGHKDPSLSVKIVTSGYRSWGGKEQVVRDPSLPAGKERIESRGSPAREIYVERLVYKDGKLIKREPLGESVYPGLITVRVVGTGKAPSKPSAPSAGPATNPTPGQDQPIPDTIPPPSDTGGGR